MKLKYTINNTTYSNYVKDEHIEQAGAIVGNLVESKLNGDTFELTNASNEVITLNASEIQAITIEF